MRILHLGKYYPPYKGGMETALRNICDGLRADGHLVSVIVAGGGRWRSRLETLGESRDRPAGRLWRAATLGTWLSQPLAPTLPRLLDREMSEFRPDVVQLHLPNPGACWAWRTVTARGKRPPLAVWYHADITRQRLTGKLIRPLVNRCLAQAAGICVSTEALANRSDVLSPWRDKVAVIPFGIDPEPWAEVTSDPRGPFLFVGRLVRYKGLRTLIRAVGALTSAKLEIVGSGPLAESLQRTIEQRGWQERIRLRGEISDAELPALMDRCCAVCLPSLDRSETFGLILLEAMAAGLPVVTSLLPTGVCEVNVEGETGWTAPPGEVEAWSRVLAAVMAAPDESRRRGEAGRRRVRAEYLRARMARDLAGWYESLIGRDTVEPAGNSCPDSGV